MGGARRGAVNREGVTVKYLLMIYVNPEILESLSEDDRAEVFRAHDELIKLITGTGELVSTAALTDPSTTATVRVREGVPAVTDGPYVEAKEYLAGYYQVDCESRERAVELALMIPDTKLTAVEVRALLDEGGGDI
jgi:hypothetical protein